MEVTLKAGDSLNIPEGCKAVIKDNVIIFEREEKEEVREFKDGDVLTSRLNNKFIFIFKEDELKQKKNENGYYVCHKANHIINVATKDKLLFCGYKVDVRLATEEEKQLLFDKMKEQGLKWNAEEKRVEKIRWRAKEGEDYYFIDIDLTVKSIDDTYSTFDNKLWNTLNYFHTKEQTAEAAKHVREALRQYHEEIGE